MYAYICEPERGFFAGVCTLSTMTTHLRDPPLSLDSRIDFGTHALVAHLV
jgi:hypothetical protein